MPVHKRNNLYLHFLDRELRDSVGAVLEDADVRFALLAAVALTPGTLFCSYSHLWESHSLLMKSAGAVQDLVAAGFLESASDYSTADEFLASRQVIYQHDANRYPFYFVADNARPVGVQPSYKTTRGATSALVGDLLADRTYRTGAARGPRSGVLRGAFEKALRSREDRAVTAALLLESQQLSLNDIAIARRVISTSYLRHYMNQCGADILTGVRGLHAYDEVARVFPYFDQRILRCVLWIAGLRWNDPASLSGLLEAAIAGRASPGVGHAGFMNEWELLVAALSATSARLRGAPSIGILESELWRAATAAKPREMGRFSYDGLAALLRALRGKLPRRDDDVLLGGVMIEDRKVLFLVATDREWHAVEEEAAARGLRPEKHPAPDLACWDLGGGNGLQYYLVRCEMGTGGAGGSALVAADAISHLKPDYVLMPGIAFGLKKGEQKIEDVLVATSVRDYDNVKLLPAVGRERGGVFPASTEMIAKARLEAEARSSIHFGEVVCGGVLSNRHKFALALKRRFPEAIGGEMEGSGLASASHRRKVQWLLVKGISDWGYGKGDSQQLSAARAAVSFSFDLVQHFGH